MDFIALDFETANYERTSACSIGLAIVEDNKVISTLHRLIRPQPNYYIHAFTDIHGLSAEMTDDQPTFDKVWQEIGPLLDGKLLVAHNVGFDLGVLRATLAHYDLPVPNFEYLCSLVVSRKYFPTLVNHKLNTVAKHLGVKLNHHHAESDAIAAAEIIIRSNYKKPVKKKVSKEKNIKG